MNNLLLSTLSENSLLKNNSSKVIIYTPFKVGSTHLQGLFKNCGYTSGIHGSINVDTYYKQCPKFAIKGHTLSMDDIFLNKRYDIWFTLVRKPTDVYMSAFFQDIVRENVPVSYPDKETVLRTSTKDLIEKFLSHDWENYEPTSFEFNFNKIKRYTGVDILSTEFNKEQGYAIYDVKPGFRHNCKKVVIMNYEIMNDDRIKDLFYALGIPYVPNKKICNAGKNKWYGKIYEALKQELKVNYPEYFTRYQNIDNLMDRKFFKTRPGRSTRLIKVR